jgi:hypothetical protein
LLIKMGHPLTQMTGCVAILYFWQDITIKWSVFLLYIHEILISALHSGTNSPEWWSL